jgi:hypothetical protein
VDIWDLPSLRPMARAGESDNNVRWRGTCDSDQRSRMKDLDLSVSFISTLPGNSSSLEVSSF